MHRSIASSIASACLLGICSAAWGQAEPDWKAKYEELEKRVAAMEKAQAAAPEVRTEETRKIAQEMSEDATKYSSDFKIVWNDGVWFKTVDEKFKLHLGGRILTDWSWVRAPGITRDRPAMGQGLDLAGNPLPLRFGDGVELRSLRLLAEGALYKYVSFKMEIDFHSEDDLRGEATSSAPGLDMVLRDAYVQLDQLPWVGHFRVGHFKEPFSLEQQTDELFLTFMEPSVANTLVPGRNFGAMFHDAELGEPGERRMTWAVGVFRSEVLGNAVDTDEDTFTPAPVLHPVSDNADGVPVHSDQGYAVTARVTGLPYYANKGAELVHVGVSYSYRGANDDHFLRYLTRPEDHNIGFPFLDVTMRNADSVNLFGAEAAAVYGPFSFQSEYVGAAITSGGPAGAPSVPNQTSDGGVCYNAFYTQASYFLTGEHRPYDTETGAFTRVRPLKNFRENGGWGAFELAARYSYIDLDEGELATFGTQVPGSQTTSSRGELNEATLGVNWYLNPNTRVSANYIRSCPVRIDTASSADIFMMRFQVDF